MLKPLIILCLILGFFGLLGWFLSPQNQLESADAIVVVSGDDGQRLSTAIELYNDGWAPRLIFVGAARDPASPSNAATMRRVAINTGVDPNSILLEERSSNTYENARLTAEIIRDQQISSIILVTSPYHQRRTQLEFDRALQGEVEIINYSAVDTAWRRSLWWISPRGWYLTLTETPKLIYAWKQTE